MFKLLIVAALFNVGRASAAADKVNPISRVVQLLEGMAKKVEQDGKVEEDLYEKYFCWAKTVIKDKTARNEAAKARIEELTAYIDDIESGRIEFTSEGGDLAAAIKGLMEEIESATSMRDKEHNDFLAAKEEMEKGIAALEKAVEVLGAATAEHKGSLLSIGREVQTFREGEHTGAAMQLNYAVELGERFLTKGDALFLQKLLRGDVPKAPDWKKLNRKSTFKMKYKARSGKIQQIMADMLQTFKDNLVDAEKTEQAEAASHAKLSGSKNDELAQAQKALNDGTKEGAARGAAKEDAQKEVDDLTAQVAADTGYIKDTQEGYDAKMAEWKERKKLRTLEIASINKAIAILDSDEARETMKSSMSLIQKSQGYLMLQKSGKTAVRKRATSMLRQFSAKDPRVKAMVAFLQAGGPLDKVIVSIEEMIETLKAEEATDLETKEKCETDREEDTKGARDLSVKIDDFTDVMTRNSARIEELNGEIKKLEDSIKKMNDDLYEAKRSREDEKAAFESGLRDDETAAGLIQQAKDVLANFYKDNELALLQKDTQKTTQQKTVKAGQAPPPPPSTPDGGYGGASAETQGIQTILQIILEDVQADIEKAKKQEKKSIEEYTKFKKDTEAAIEDSQKTIEDYKGEIAECEKTIEETKEDRKGAFDALVSVMEEIKVKAPNCEFMTVNFKTRVKNRQLEIDGLLKAKAILQGASFGL